MKKLCAIGLIALGARVTIYSQEIQTYFNVESKDEIRKSSCSDRKSVIGYITKLSESPCEIISSALLFKPPQKTISDLPNEIITKIFRYLDTKSKLQCAQTSTQFKAIADYQRSLVPAIDSESKDYIYQDFNFYRGPQLKRISIKGKHLKNINLTHLKLCENLEELTLADVNLADDQFENLFSALPSLPHLEVLNLSGVIQASGYQLGIHVTHMQESNLEHFLQKSSKLKTLKIPNIEFDNASESIFRQLPSTLQDLDLNGCWVMPHQVDGLLKSLTRCSGLTSLVLSENNLYDYKYVEDLFKSLPQTLEILKLGSCQLKYNQTAALFKRLPLLKNLHTLDLSGNMLNLLQSNAFQECFPQSLERVDLSDCDITREQSEILLETMSTLKKLQEVRFDWSPDINVESLQELNNLPDLQAIFIRNSGLKERPAGIAKNIEVYTD